MTDAKKQERPFLISDARLSYCYIFQRYKGDDGEGKFSVHFIFSANHPQLAAMQTEIRRVATERWGDKAETVLAALKAQDKLPIHRGDISKAGQEPYAGKLFISAANDVKPRIVATINGVNQEVDESSDYAPYSGCHANGIVTFWAQDNKYGKRINAQVTGVQFLRHDTRLGGGGRAASLDEFAVAPVEADSEAPATGDNSLL